MRRLVTTLLGGAAILTLAAAVGCGGGDSSPTSPSPPPSTGGGGGTTGGTTVTISASGVSPKSITVSPGTRVTFTNNDNRPHDMASDPHPTHGSCPEIESGVGFLNAGQTKLTLNLNTVGSCTYHDHNDPTNAGLQGTIRIQ